MARLDRLGPAKEVAQIGAAIGREFSHALLAAVVRRPEAELDTALDRLIAADLLLRQGVPPHASYLFKHALVQDAAYGTLLREPRRALHARIAEAIESQFAEIAENQPELLARHCAAAGLIEKAAGLWGKAGQRSLARSALVEAAEQLTRALAQIAALPATPSLRREAIKLQVALITPLIHVKGYAAPETKTSEERARLLIEQAEALGEPLDDPLLLFSVLYGVWVANIVAFDGDKHARACSAIPYTRRETESDRPAHDRASRDEFLLTVDRRHGGKPGTSRSGRRALRSCRAPSAGDAIWRGYRGCWYSVIGLGRCGCLAIPKSALADIDHALRDAREIGQAATLMFAPLPRIADPYTLRKLCGSERARRGTCRFGGGKRRLVLEGWRNVDARERVGPDRRSLGCSPNAHLSGSPHGGQQEQHSWYRCGYHIWPEPMPNSANSMMLGVALDEAFTAVETTKEKMVRGRSPPDSRRNRVDVAGAGRGESGSLFRARAGGRPRAASEVLGTARGDEHGAALARSGQARRSPRSARARLRLVHRRLRHARPERGQGAARRAGAVTALLSGVQLAQQPAHLRGSSRDAE